MAGQRTRFLGLVRVIRLLSQARWNAADGVPSLSSVQIGRPTGRASRSRTCSTRSMGAQTASRRRWFRRDVTIPPLRVVQGRQPEAFQVLHHELGELFPSHRRKQGRWRLAIQDKPEVVQLAPGHRGDWPAHELLVRPSEVQARRRRRGCSCSPLSRSATTPATPSSWPGKRRWHSAVRSYWPST
jgi:hypothetical protein